MQVLSNNFMYKLCQRAKFPGEFVYTHALQVSDRQVWSNSLLDKLFNQLL